jgi:hypothetical protein
MTAAAGPATPDAAPAALPPAAPDVVAAAVESLSPRLRKKLDAATEQYAAEPVAVNVGTFSVSCGEDAVVTLAPGPEGAVTQADQATCTCLLAPRCLHRAAVLGACPVASGIAEPESHTSASTAAALTATDPETPDTLTQASPASEVTPAQISAAAGLWSAAAAVLTGGIPAAGAVPQAELLRAAHTARLAGLHRAEAAALRVVNGLRSARARRAEHRLADLVAALRELLLTTVLLAATDTEPSLIGAARRAYQPGGALRVHGVCREPVISATGYAGVVTHLLAEDGRWYSASDVKPGGPGRARAAATAPVAIGAAGLDHGQLARGGLLINGATVSPDGRLGSGKEVRATPLSGLPWSAGPIGALLDRPLADVAAQRLAVTPADDEARTEATRELMACDVEVLAGQGDHLLVRELASSTLIRLIPADAHADLAHTSNLRQLASRPGLRIRLVGRLDPDRAATMRPLAAGPVPDTEATLRLPEEWLGRADLGYDRLQGSHLPPLSSCPPPEPVAVPLDPMADSPLWRYRHLVELAVSGGRRTVAESARRADRTDHTARVGETFAPLRAAGFNAAADLATRLVQEADRRDRDVFGRLTDPDPDGYAKAWLAAAAHLAATERAMVLASWQRADM